MNDPQVISKSNKQPVYQVSDISNFQLYFKERKVPDV